MPQSCAQGGPGVGRAEPGVGRAGLAVAREAQVAEQGRHARGEWAAMVACPVSAEGLGEQMKLGEGEEAPLVLDAQKHSLLLSQPLPQPAEQQQEALLLHDSTSGHSGGGAFGGQAA